MALRIQDHEGTVTDANGYVTVEEVRAYHAERGEDLTAEPDEKLETAIVRATDYLDSRYAFKGRQVRREQGTQFPRSGGIEKGVPRAIKMASCVLALRVLRAKTKTLLPDPEPVVQATTKTVGPISTSTTYAVSARNLGLPNIPEVDLALRSSGWLASSNSGRIERA